MALCVRLCHLHGVLFDREAYNVQVAQLFHADAAERDQIVKALAARLAGDPTVRFAYLHGSFLDGRSTRSSRTI